jgi:hypothetical protein
MTTTIHAGDRTSGCVDCAKNDETLRAEGALSWSSEATPTYAEAVGDLYNWSGNFDNFAPFRKFLDLIGYAEEMYGEEISLADWKNPSFSLGYIELGKLGEALTEYANRPQEVTRFIAELLEVEEEFGL